MRVWKKSLFLLFLLGTAPAYAETKEAIFAGGCFWCLQADFDELPGVIKTIAGYDGGQSPNPTYEEVSSGSTHYAESVKVIYDTDKISYQIIVDYFWHHIDPTVQDAQFCDTGKQYRTAVFYLDETQKRDALSSLEKIKKQLPSSDKIYTEITPSTHFYPAETYHQSYYLKNPVRYEFYRWSCGRDARVKEVWHEKTF